MVDFMSLFDVLPRLSQARVLCIGDVMLDRFVYGSVERISPEAPIPVLRVDHEKHMLGGAGNVVANLRALGVQTALLAATGDDLAGKDIERKLRDAGIQAFLDTDAARTTTVKSRFISGQQQILRVDREKTDALSLAAETRLMERVKAVIKDFDVVILSDYNKGLLTENLIAAVMREAQKADIPVIVDPKGTDYTRYRGATVLTPNRKELEAATGMNTATDDDVRAAAMKLIMTCGVATVLATRSKDGMSLIGENLPPVHIPAHVREVFDVSGAGDTVIATFAAALAAGAEITHAAFLSNVAAGIAVEKPGTATVRCDEIAKILREDFTTMPKFSKTMDRPALQAQRQVWKEQGKKVGFTNGCFDLLHPGHLSVLRQAKAACDVLIVALNSDSSVKRLKGPTRPVQSEDARAELLAALEVTDAVIIFEEDTPYELIRALKPDVLVKGGQYKLEEVVGYDILQGYGGQIVRADMEDGFSTTNTIARMK